MTLMCVAIDVLHVLDLGISAHVLGNIFYIVCEKRRGGTRAARVARLGEEIEEWHRSRGLKSGLRGKLTEARLKSASGFAKLKAKGASVRSLMAFALDLARRESLNERIIGLISYLAEFYQIMNSQGIFLDESAVERMQFIVHMFCNLYTDLSADAFKEGSPTWKATPKLHLFYI